MNRSIFHFLRNLDAMKIWYELARYQDDTIDINITVPGKRIEVSFFEDGSVKYSIFDGTECPLKGLEHLDKILKEYAD